MSTANSEIRSLCHRQFERPQKFKDFCHNEGQPLGGLIHATEVSGTMNATFQTIDPGSHEVLQPSVKWELQRWMQPSEVLKLHTNRVQTAGDKPVDEKISVIMRLVELCERDRDVLLACEIFDGGKVSELAEGDF